MEQFEIALLGWLAIILFLVFVIFGVFWLVQRFRSIKSTKSIIIAIVAILLFGIVEYNHHSMVVYQRTKTELINRAV